MPVRRPKPGDDKGPAIEVLRAPIVAPLQAPVPGRFVGRHPGITTIHVALRIGAVVQWDRTPVKARTRCPQAWADRPIAHQAFRHLQGSQRQGVLDAYHTGGMPRHAGHTRSVVTIAAQSLGATTGNAPRWIPVMPREGVDVQRLEVYLLHQAPGRYVGQSDADGVAVALRRHVQHNDPRVRPGNPARRRRGPSGAPRSCCPCQRRPAPSELVDNQDIDDIERQPRHQRASQRQELSLPGRDLFG